MKQIEDYLHLKQTHDHLDAALATGRSLTRLARRCGYRLPDVAEDHVLTFWRKYFYRGRLEARIVRVLAGLVAMGVLWCILVLIFGNPRAPTRGDIIAVFYYAVTPLPFVATLALIFFLPDSPCLPFRLTRNPLSPPTLFPALPLR